MDTNLLDKAMKMPPKERVAFAELILASIDYEGTKESRLVFERRRKHPQSIYLNTRIKSYFLTPPKIH